MSQTSPVTETVGCGTPGCADPNCTYGRDDDWPPVKKALWGVLMDEKLNAGHYIKAFDLIEKLHAAVLSAGLAQTPAEPGMQGAVQYRRKDGGYGPGWITMAMFDGTLAAENYLALQRKDDSWPYEYRAIEIPAVSDTSTDRGGK